MSEPFLIPDDRAILELDDPRWAGAEIVCRLNVPLSVYRLIAGITPASDGEQLLADLSGMFLANVIEWNLHDHEGPISLSAEGLERLPVDICIDALLAWIGAIQRPSRPLVGQPAAGGRSRVPRASPRRAISSGTSSSTASSGAGGSAS